jgi:hypothetical protein
VLRGIRILTESYTGCMEKQVPGIVKVTLMGQAYYRFAQEYPDYLRLIHFYGSERFSRENPYAAEIGKGYGTCRLILADAIAEGNRWKLVIEAEGFNYEQFASEFFRFIIPAIASGEGTCNVDFAGFELPGFLLTESILPEGEQEKRS